MSPRLPKFLSLCTIALALTSGAYGQEHPATSRDLQNNGPAKSPAAAHDYSKEPFVIESISTKLVFANDGTYASDTTAQIRIQSQAGIQNFSLLTFPYASANGNLEIPYVRVRKSDGTTVVTPPGNIQDMPADITRSAPFYSDIREKQVAVKALDAGDVLEYEYVIHVTTPLIPGQFWYSYDFFKAGIALDEELQISVPRDRYVNVQSADVKPATSDEAGYKVYSWKTAHLQDAAETEKTQNTPVESPPPAVQLTTFRSWDEVGQWFRGLQESRIAPTSEVHAKADELTDGATSDSEKLHAIYNFVSLKIRYVGIAFGIGRYQPHAAADVLSNEYGDCKDKQTLLTSLLSAEGVKSYPTLVNSSRKIDPALPSPGQFDHVIAAVPQGSDFLWLDTTAEVAPFGFLTANLRDKEALVIPSTGPAHLVHTPPDPPFKTTFDFHIDGKLNDAGTLDAKARASFRGDAEFLLRSAFRITPQPQWKDLIQRVSYLWNFGGSVSDVSASAPDVTDSPFQLNYDYTRKDYSDWTDKRISPPLPPVFAADISDKAKTDTHPFELGAIGRDALDASVTLPPGFTPTVPPPVDVVQDFAEYHAKYSFSNGVLYTQRIAIVKAREIPPSRRDDYAKFLKIVHDDENSYISLQQASAAVTQYQPSPEVQKLYQQARQAWQQSDMNGALDDLQRAVTIDPKFGLGWTALGMTHMAVGNTDQGLDEMKKATTVAPKALAGYEALASVQLRLRRPEDALDTWRQLEKADPQGSLAPTNAGSILISLKRYKDALPELELAVKRVPNSHLFILLGLAYTQTSHPNKALASFTQALQLDSSPLTLNDVAFYLADANLDLNLALTNSQKAVQQEEELTSKISLDTLAYSDLPQMGELAAFWDTLGWVHFRLGHLDQAERFLTAAWNLSQAPDLADHLGQVYEKEDKIQRAEQLYALAVASARPVLVMAPSSSPSSRMTLQTPGNAMSDTRARLVNLLKSNSRAVEAISKAHDTLSELRTIKLPKITSKSATAEFFILFAKGPQVVDVKFISGADELRDAGKYLSSAKFTVSFPDDGETHLIRRGVLDCEPELPYCQFILVNPGDVHSLN